MLLRFPILATLLLSAVVCLGAAPNLFPTASAVVYSLTVNGPADKDAGGRLAVLFAQQLADNGVRVVAPPLGTERKDYLEVARKLGVDYYVTGFITPLGPEVSVVEQIVSTVSGTVVFSNSAQMLTYADAGGQGAILATAIQKHAARALANLEAAPIPSASAAPEKTNEANLSGLLKRKPKAAAATPQASAATQAAQAAQTAQAQVQAVAAASATPQPKPQSRPRRRSGPPATVAPSALPVPVMAPPSAAASLVLAPGSSPNRVAVFEVGGSATSERRAFARRTLEAVLQRNGRAIADAGALNPAAIVPEAAALCAKNGAKTLVDAQLATHEGDPAFGPSTTAQFDVRAVDCNGRVLLEQRYERHAQGSHNWERAVTGAVDAAAAPLTRALAL
ncbi:MAG: hypothetical protein JO101_05645 [Candidatus Eremiobacteraeota bacterium]|nr:hypothetical protein [Candidatus Eremiobacteraeota bacterium]